jgi:hypothetical protein
VSFGLLLAAELQLGRIQPNGDHLGGLGILSTERVAGVGAMRQRLKLLSGS